MHLLSLSDTLNFCINWLFFLQNTCLRGTSWIDDVIWPHWQYPGFEIEFKHQVFIKLEEPLSQPMKRYKSFAIKFCMFLKFSIKIGKKCSFWSAFHVQWQWLNKPVSHRFTPSKFLWNRCRFLRAIKSCIHFDSTVWMKMKLNRIC